MGAEYEILARLGLALGIGFLIGIERGWRERELGEGERTAGLRTFTLIALSGGVWALLLPALGPVPLAAGFLAVAGAIALFRWRETEKEGTLGATTLVAALLTFALGAYAVVGDKTAAAAAAVATTALLAAKPLLHAWVRALSWPELRASLTLLAMSFIVLPVLPDRGFGPYQALNPHTVWLMAIAVAGISFAGYVAVKVLGERYGVPIAAAAGGLVSSTLTTIDMARKGKAGGRAMRIYLSGALAASAIMFLRVGVIVAVFGPHLLDRLAGPVAAAAIVLAGAAFALGLTWKGETGASQASPYRNPFELRSVLLFAAVLAIILIVTNVLSAAYGGAGGIAAAAVSGVADVDAITLSMTSLAGRSISLAEAAVAILVAATANSLSKSGLALVFGGFRFAIAFLGITLAALTAGGLVAYFFGQWSGGP